MSSLRYFDQIQYGSFDGLEVLVNPDDNSLWVLQRSVQALLGWDRLDATGVRAKLKSASLSSFAESCKDVGATVNLGDGYNAAFTDSLGRRNTAKFIPINSFMCLLAWQYSTTHDTKLFVMLSPEWQQVTIQAIGLMQQDTKKESIKGREKAIQEKYAVLLDGHMESLTDCGRVDILTNEYAYEVKECKGWKGGMGQALAYAFCCKKKAGLILFNCGRFDKELIKSVCNGCAVRVVFDD